MAEERKFVPPALRQGATAAVRAGVVADGVRRQGLRGPPQHIIQQRRRDNAAGAIYEARGVRTRINRDILRVTNGFEIFQRYPVFNECEDIHFHIYPIFGAGIRFRFQDGSELKYDIPSDERRGPFFGLKYSGANVNYKNIPVNNNRDIEHTTENYIYQEIEKPGYDDTSVQRAIRACAELPNPRDPRNGNGFSSFMELIEDLTGIVAQRVDAGGKKGSRKTRKYKKRRVRKSRKKIKSRKSRKIKRASKSRKNKKSSKSRKSRRRSSVRRRR